MKKIIIGAIIVVSLIVLALIAIFVISSKGIFSRDTHDEEKKLLITIDNLAPYCGISGNRSLCESYNTKHNIDGTIEIEYKYDTDKDPETEKFLYFTSEAEKAPTIQIAKESFSGRITAYKMGITMVPGRKLEENQSLFTLGEDNFASIVKQDDNSIGTIVVTRKKKIVYSFLIYGIIFDEREPLESLFKSIIR